MKFESFVANPLMQAPLAGYTDAGFRYLCGKYGCGLVVTEMVSAMSLKQKNRVAFDLLKGRMPKNSVSKVAVQLFGHDPEVFAEVVRYDEIQKFDVIDINMGCPVHKVVKNGDGSALMLDLPLASKVISQTVKHSKKPVTVKFRKGFTENNVNAPEFAKMCFESGASAVTVHGRTREQMYTGQADMETVRSVVEAAGNPVYANGDIKSKEDADRVKQYTGAFGIAIGRGAVGKPYIYADILGVPFEKNLYDDICTHYDVLLEFLPEKVVACEMKKHLAVYLKGLRGVKNVMNEIFNRNSADDQLRLVKDFLKNV